MNKKFAEVVQEQLEHQLNPQFESVLSQLTKAKPKEAPASLAALVALKEAELKQGKNLKKI